MAARGEGAIVNVTSIQAFRPAPALAHYSAAKAGLEMLTRSAALELGPTGVRVNAVAPGLIWREGIESAWPEGVARYRRATPRSDASAEPEDVADACLFLASRAARFVTGTTLVVDGGVLAGGRLLEVSVAPLPLGGKVVFVTGGGRGIGRGIAQACAEAGADVALGDLRARGRGRDGPARRGERPARARRGARRDAAGEPRGRGRGHGSRRSAASTAG